jgi:hypothetical protein
MYDWDNKIYTSGIWSDGVFRGHKENKNPSNPSGQKKQDIVGKLSDLMGQKKQDGASEPSDLTD